MTVGTTLFDALVRAADTTAIHAALRTLGFTKMTMQIGQSAYVPVAHTDGPPALEVETFTLAPSLAPYLTRSQLVRHLFPQLY